MSAAPTRADRVLKLYASMLNDMSQGICMFEASGGHVLQQPYPNCMALSMRVSGRGIRFARLSTSE